MAQWTRKLVSRPVIVGILVLAIYRLGIDYPSLIQPRWMVLALEDQETIPDAGRLDWRLRSPGLETAELTVFFHEEQVDVMHLVRLDPAKFRLLVRANAKNPKLVEDWQTGLSAAAVVNGSYFVRGNFPQTPLMANGRRLGPKEYKAEHGMFIGGEKADIVDLLGTSYLERFENATDAMVSYPLLLDASGRVRAEGNAEWLANRTFVAKDKRGFILLGTTETGFFSLRRLGRFLAKEKRLEITLALNFDGGPLASQMVVAGDYQKRILGSFERQDGSSPWKDCFDRLSLDRWELPIVVAAVAIDAKK